MYKYLLATKYLKKRFAAYLAIAGIALGITVLIVVTSVMSGFSKQVHSKIRGTSSHINVSRGMGRLISNYRSFIAEIRKIDHVKGVAPHLEWLGLIHEGTWYVNLIGIDPKLESSVTDIEKYICDGNLNFKLNEDIPQFPGAIAGMGIYANPLPTPQKKEFYLKGVTLPVFTVKPALSIRQYKGINRNFTLTGWFSSGMSDYDSHTIYVPISAIQKMLNAPGTCSKICVSLDNYDDPTIISSVKKSIREIIDKRYHSNITFLINTWEEEKANYLKAVEMEKNLQVIILFFIILVASFIVFAVLNMIVNEKKRDIGILRSLGCPIKGIVAIFFLEGIIISSIGSIVGLCSGFLIALNLNPIADLIHKITGWHPFPPDVYIIDKIPSNIDTNTIALILILNILLSAIASMYPALKAALMKPVESLRYE